MTHIFHKSNLKKTYSYLKRNGPRAAFYGAMERILCERNSKYTYMAPKETELDRQRRAAKGRLVLFSILVPAYETEPVYLKGMIASVLEQTYPLFELIIADASLSDKVENTVEETADERIRYCRLSKNNGISANTNEALALARGDYVGLLDHDDLLTPDALFQMSEAIEECKKRQVTAKLLYSDEDKGNDSCTAFYEPNRKPGLNVELLLSNNYICHFLVMKRELMEKLAFRPAYDGAQDYDLVLRAVWQLQREKESIIHIPSVLYHWRCHSGSTAENPESKSYAYEAGRRAVEDFVKNAGWHAKVENTRHLGFYMLHYRPDIFAERPEVGVTGGRLLDRKGKNAGGIYEEDGQALYEGLHREYSGYMHRASLRQEACAVDVRRMRVREELWGLFEECFGVPYRETEGYFDWKSLPPDGEEGVRADTGATGYYRRKSLAFCRKVRQAGYLIVWMPEDTVRI